MFSRIQIQLNKKFKSNSLSQLTWKYVRRKYNTVFWEIHKRKNISNSYIQKDNGTYSFYFKQRSYFLDKKF